MPPLRELAPLIEHQVPCPLPFYDDQGRYLFAAPGKVDVLAEVLLASVLARRDNELFVLLVDLLETGPHLEKLLRAVRVAPARHHQVLVVCPWPPGVPVPGRRHEQSKTAKLPATLHDQLARATGAAAGARARPGAAGVWPAWRAGHLWFRRKKPWP